MLVYHFQFARTDQLDALARFDLRPRLKRQCLMLGQRLAERDQRRCFRQPVDVRQFPAEIALDELNGRGRGGAPAVNSRTPRGAPARISAGALAMLISTVGAAQSMVIRSSVII